ncbi:MAG: right-handed parallel beta-helix repeat-containing protein [Acidobacteriota bacterium]
MMRIISNIYRRGTISWTLALLMVFAFAGLMASQNSSANHPVLVEGNNAGNGGPGSTTVPAGSGGDYDGDGMVGAAEDTDNGADRIFGTIGAALLGANGGANANGHVIIVTSGRFPESVMIPNTAGGQTAVNGVTIIEAAPGVQANIDAVLQGDANNATRMAGSGITINTMSTDRGVILRNLAIRNYSEGITVLGTSRVQVVNCRLDSNLNFGIRAAGMSRVTVLDSFITASGMRFTAAGPGTPGPGTGVRFEEQSTGALIRTTVSGNTAAGVNNASTRGITLVQSAIFDNDRNFMGGNVANPTPFHFASDATQLDGVE